MVLKLQTQTKTKAPKGKVSKGKIPKGKAPKGKVPKGKVPKGKVPKGKAPTGKAPKGKKQKSIMIGVPTNRRDKLVDMQVMKSHDFLSITEPTLTRIKKLHHVEGNKYEVDAKEHSVSTIMKLILNVVQSNDLSYDWSAILWNISQRPELLPPTANVTFTRVFERKDNEMAKKEIGRRRKLAVLSSESEESLKRQSTAVWHDRELIRAIDQGDSVMTFGAEAIVTAPDDQTLETAVNAIKDYMATNDETRGIKYEIDINKQNRPFVLFGPNGTSGNKDVFVEMTSHDASLSALFVDAGGDRTLGSEYIGVSVGKLIRSHAAYNLQHHRSLYIGNDTQNKTFVMGSTYVDTPSQVYWSKIASRSYLLKGSTVTHFVLDNAKTVKHLMDMPLDAKRKVMVDVSHGLLNIMEAIDNGELAENKERILSRFPTHINNIISLLTQFRDSSRISTTDDFANLTREVLINFFVTNKYWSYDARYDLNDVRLIGVKHEEFKQLSDFGQYVNQRMKNNKDSRLAEALFELNTIVNNNILPTIPSLDTKTAPIIDDLVRVPFRVIDLTGTTTGAMSNVSNPSTNVMMISYLNLVLPTLKNGDVIVIHGFSRLSSIASVITDMITASGLNLDVIFTEGNQSNAITMIESNDSPIDFTVLDLYSNRIDKLLYPLEIDEEWATTLSQNPAAFYIKSRNSMDYIYLDDVL